MIDKEIAKKYLNDRKCGVIATCKDNKPRASTMIYYPDGWTVYFCTDLNSTKIKNIKVNSNVSIAVDDQVNGTGCFQADGIATILTEKQKEEISKKFEKLNRPDRAVVRIDLKKISFVEDHHHRERIILFEV